MAWFTLFLHGLCGINVAQRSTSDAVNRLHKQNITMQSACALKDGRRTKRRASQRPVRFFKYVDEDSSRSHAIADKARR
jgi:hypothetical protein